MGQKLLQLIPPNIGEKAVVWGYNLAATLLIFLGFFVASVIAKSVICRVGQRTDPLKEEVLLLIGQIAKTAILTFGTVTALGTLGINVSALVAGLGLTGFALGFAFRDALSNVLAGVMIMMYRPFRRGDHVKVTDYEGQVTGIDLRYTTLQGETRKYLIPNSMLLTNAISLDRTKTT